MAISDRTPEAVVAGGTAVALSQLFNLTGQAGSAPYLVLCGLDRDEYTAGATGQTGRIDGSAFTSIGGDGRGDGIVFTYQASTGQYVSAAYGTLAQASYVASTSPGDVTDLSLFATGNAALAQAYADNAYALMQADASGFLGSATVVTSGVAARAGAPAAATPDGIAAAAESFVGQAWNMDGCWVLASTIAAEAGAALPVQSTSVGSPGAANGEWSVIYDGPVSASGQWQNLVSTGDVVVFSPAGGGGHITTCVSGSGSTAQLIDNITYESASGSIVNAAGDGDAADVLVAPAHPASQEFAGVNPGSVVIYALDTPAIAVPQAAVSAVLGTKLALAGFVHATDPAGHAVTAYQLYDSLAGASFVLANGVSEAARSVAGAITVASLGGVGLAYTQAGTDTLEVRAENGAYWGDWQAISVGVGAPKPAPPRVTVQTANQSWAQGSSVSLVLAANTFTDPQGLKLSYAASLAHGAALPAWLVFDPATLGFSGKVPAGAASLPVTVTATDSAGLSASETFTATVPAAAPVVAVPVAGQSWLEGGQIVDKLPAGTFTDPQGQALTVRASLASGAALPAWLSFSAANDAFSGTAPKIAESLAIRLTATDVSGLAVSDVFTATVAAAASSAAGFAMRSSVPEVVVAHALFAHVGR